MRHRTTRLSPGSRTGASSVGAPRLWTARRAADAQKLQDIRMTKTVVCYRITLPLSSRA
ncbi:hypothetical protein BVI434_1020006 [Burkholderia vietnamiensis]|nr:hypothetical protein BVI434_1020006 [Burkholderia vietnamiensis]